MNADDTAHFVYAGVAALLVASSFFARRLPIGQSLKMILAWAAIFGIGIILFSFRHEAKTVWNRVKSELSSDGIAQNDSTIRIRKSEDGHFWVNALLNGKSVRLLIDSGATTTGLTLETARSANIDTSGAAFPVFIDTANGTIKAQRARVASFKIGSIQRNDFGVIVAENFGDTNVVGMNFLSTLESWRVEGDELILNPKDSKPDK